MRRRLIIALVSILSLAAFAVYVDWPGTPGLPLTLADRDLRDLEIRQGLDLQGGLHVVFQADPVPGQEILEGAMEAVKEIIENRVNALGVAEPVIQIEGDDRIIVELPGVSDPDEAIKLFKETGSLEIFGTGFVPFEEGSFIDETTEGAERILTGADVKDASVGFDEIGNPEIVFELTDAGGGAFQNHTTANIGQWMSITLDGRVIQSAVIQAAISTRGRITGNFNAQEARRVAIQLRYGALPVPLRVVQNLTVGPTLGQDSLAKSVRAGLVGFVLVLLFMVAYYRLPGLVASLALFLYAALVLAIFKLVPVTLTLAGIAGFILSVGMAVDANILIFERTKEELRSRLTIGAAVEAGFRRAWNSIRDSNVATLITCAVLWQFGSGVVRGFALTLAIGVLVSMFSAITASRTFMRVVVRLKRAQDPRWYGVDSPAAETAP